MTCSVYRALAALLFVTASPALAQGRAPSTPQQFIYFGRDRERINEPAFLTNPAIAGAQLRYSWRELETARDRYDFQPVLDDIAILAAHGKRLFIQVQDVTFSDILPVPDYLRSEEFNGGAERKWESSTSGVKFDGWVARRWDAKVRLRFIQLLDTLGRATDARIAGINLPETAIGFEDGGAPPRGYSPDAYVAGVKAVMSAAHRAFPHAVVIQYANFMPGDDPPSTPFLHDVYAHAAAIGVGVGGPDILPFRRFQQMNSLPLIARRPANVPAGMAVQDGNLRDVNPATQRRVTVPELYRYAAEELHLDYIFWGTEEPFYTDAILPFLRTRTPPRQ
ncbi:MAG: hypothetical protein ACYC3L_15310 [Gemmatimonadaceae bacterium]